MMPVDRRQSAALPIQQGTRKNMLKSLSMKTMRSSPAKTAAHPFADKQKITKEVRRVNTTTISQRDAYKLMLKEYPDVMNIEQMCEILGISTKTGYRILREGKVCCIKVGRAYRIPKAHLFTYRSIGCAELQEAANA